MKPYAGEAEVSADLEFEGYSILVIHPAEYNFVNFEGDYTFANTFSQAKQDGKLA